MTWQQRRQAVMAVIDWMTREGEAHYRAHLARHVGDRNGMGAILRVAEQRFDFMSPEEVSRLKTGRAIAFGTKVARIAPPSDKTRSAVALLNCYWLVDDGFRQCRFYYGLWERLDTHPDVQNPASVITFSAHRLEIPEIGDNHNYHHAQYCTSIGLNDTKAPREAIGLSTSYPAWPIAAKDEVQLALCLVVALYGYIGLRKFETFKQDTSSLRHHEILGDALIDIKGLQMRQ